MCGQFRLPSHLHARNLGAGASFTWPAADKVAFKLCQSAEHGQHKPPLRCRGVCPFLARERNPACLPAILPRVFSRSRIERARRSSGITVTTSPASRCRAIGEAGSGQSWHLTPPRGIRSCSQPPSVGAPVQRSGRPSRLVRSRISWGRYAADFCSGKGQSFQSSVFAAQFLISALDRHAGSRVTGLVDQFPLSTRIGYSSRPQPCLFKLAEHPSVPHRLFPAHASFRTVPARNSGTSRLAIAIPANNAPPGRGGAARAAPGSRRVRPPQATPCRACLERQKLASTGRLC